MGCIFGGASHVVSCLGPALDASADAFPLLRCIASKLDDIEELKAKKGIYWLYALGMTFEDSQTILAFFCNPFFERLWVVQEVVMAKPASIQCGNDVMSWHELATALHVFSKAYLPSGFPIHPNVATAQLIMDLTVPDPDRSKLSFLLDQFSV
jgi:hypothetical protein